MFKSKLLENIPRTLSTLGDPYIVTGTNANLQTTAPGINYALKVLVDTSIDLGIGRLGSKTAMNYGSQQKVVRGDDGVYWSSVRGFDRITNQTFVTDPSWDNTESIISYDSAGKLYFLDLIGGYSYARAGQAYGTDYFTYENDYAFRMVFTTPAHPGTDAYDFYPAFGWYDGNFAAEATASTFGVVLQPSTGGGTTWSLTLRRKGTSDLVRRITQIPASSVIVLDGLLHMDTGKLEFVAHSDGVKLGRIVSEEGYFVYGTDIPDHIGVWAVNSAAGSDDFECEILSFQAWQSTAVIKKSLDNGNSWRKIITNPVDFTVENQVKEVAIGIDDGGEIYATYVQKSTAGASNGYWRVYRGELVSGSDTWSNVSTVSVNEANDKTNAQISIDIDNTTMHLAWQADPGSGANIKFRDVDIIPS